MKNNAVPLLPPYHPMVLVQTMNANVHAFLTQVKVAIATYVTVVRDAVHQDATLVAVNVDPSRTHLVQVQDPSDVRRINMSRLPSLQQLFQSGGRGPVVRVAGPTLSDEILQVSWDRSATRRQLDWISMSWTCTTRERRTCISVANLPKNIDFMFHNTPQQQVQLKRHLCRC